MINDKKRELRHDIRAFIKRSDLYYIAECFDISVVTQGKTIDETIENLKEAVSLHLKGEDLSDFGLVKDPTLLVTIELEPFLNVA